MCARVIGQQADPMRDVLQQNSLGPAALATAPGASLRISSYAIFNSDTEFVIGYYVATGEEVLKPPLVIARLDKTTNQWEQRQFDGFSLKPLEGMPISAGWIGSVNGISRAGPWLYVGLHLSPSAVCMVVLDPQLEVVDTIPGWIRAHFSSGAVIYEGNMVHFADVHPASLFLYEPRTRTKRLIYPQAGDRERADFSARLSKLIDPQRCSRNNWGCDTSRFTSDVGEVAVNEDANTVAFRVQYQPEGFLDREKAEDLGLDDAEYIYIVRLKDSAYRSYSIYDVKPMFGTDVLSELLEPQRLKNIFPK